MFKFFESVAGLAGKTEGTTQVEQLVLIVVVALGFAAAAVPLGSLLLSYHRGIEVVLAMPIP